MQPILKANKTVPGGLLVAFEGVDGAGKSTQAKMAQARLEKDGYSAIYLKEPTDGPIGRQLRQMMLYNLNRDYLQEFELFLRDREEDVRLNILPMLNSGGIVCIDRYYISSMAYQGALGLDPEFIRIENEKIAPVPDLILHFQISLVESLNRILSSRPEGLNLFEIKEYQEKVHALFEGMQFNNLHRVDASQPVNWLHNQVMSLIHKKLTLINNNAKVI